MHETKKRLVDDRSLVLDRRDVLAGGLTLAAISRVGGCMSARLMCTTLALLALTAYTSRRATNPESSTATRDITITRRDAQQTSVGPVGSFTGTVHVQRLFFPAPPSRMQGAYVTFEPGAHTAWHTHPVGQILVVTAGTGYVQQWGGARQDIHEGDVVWTPPNVKHWHGATPTSPMTHMAIVEQLDGQRAEWMEKVTDAQYDAQYNGAL